MKKINRFLEMMLIVILIQTSAVYTQVQYGLKAGLTSSNISITNIIPRFSGTYSIVIDKSLYEGQMISPSIGIWTKVLDTDLISLELESNYLHKGSSRTLEMAVTTPEKPLGTLEKMTLSFVLKYIQLNINPQIKYSIRELTVYGIFGVSINYLLRAETIWLKEEKRKDLTIGYNVGFGLDLDKFLSDIFVEVKFNGDFYPYYQDYADFKNQVWMISIGYRI